MAAGSGVSRTVRRAAGERRLRGFAALLACGCAAPALAADADYPQRTIRWVVAFAPGGSLDRVARMLAPRLSEALGQPVVIDNRPGAGGNLSAELVARSAPDGYTLYVTSGAIVVNASLYRRLPYDPLNGFAPVTLLGAAYNVLVAHPSLPVRSVADLIALARRRPGGNISASGRCITLASSNRCRAGFHVSGW